MQRLFQQWAAIDSLIDQGQQEIPNRFSGLGGLRW
jgi:hypothetical protein